MAVSYQNNWQNILTALMSKVKAEMKCPVFSDWYNESKSNHFIRIIPTSSTQGDVTKFSEHRTFNMDLNYYILNRNDKQFQKYVFNQTSILEALIHDNVAMSYVNENSVTENVFNCRFESTDLNTEQDEGIYVVLWDFKCQHLGNVG